VIRIASGLVVCTNRPAQRRLPVQIVTGLPLAVVFVRPIPESPQTQGIWANLPGDVIGRLPCSKIAPGCVGEFGSRASFKFCGQRCGFAVDLRRQGRRDYPPRAPAVVVVQVVAIDSSWPSPQCVLTPPLLLAQARWRISFFAGVKMRLPRRSGSWEPESFDPPSRRVLRMLLG